jgi:hypothetical protein
MIFFVFFIFLAFWPFPWQQQPFWKNQPLKGQFHMAYGPPKVTHIVFALFLIIILIISLLLSFFRQKFVRHISRRCLDQTLWNLVGISYAMWNCPFKGWFFQNGCCCHGNKKQSKHNMCYLGWTCLFHIGDPKGSLVKFQHTHCAMLIISLYTTQNTKGAVVVLIIWQLDLQLPMHYFIFQ